MPQDEFLSIEGAVEKLAKLGQTYSADRIRALIDSGLLSCAVYWLTRYSWLYVDPRGAAHHEKHGWPEWAAFRPEDASPNENNPDPRLIFFIDDKDHPNLNDRIGRPRPGGPGGLNLANFRPGLFIPAAAIEGLAAESMPASGNFPAPPRPMNAGRAQELALLAAIRKAGYEPEALRKAPNGLPGVRSEIKKILRADRQLFRSDNVFNKAWHEALTNGQIKYRT